MENLRKRVNIKLCTDESQFVKHAARPSFISFKKFSEDLIAIHKIKETLKLKKPVYVGVAILDLSKVLMYDFHYNWTKNKYGDRARLLFTDTDSLVYDIQTEDIYADIYEDRHLFDLSEWKGPRHDPTNKNIVGKMKDETAGRPIREFVGLRSKMYSVMEEGGSGTKKAKGIKKYVVRSEIRHENYREVLFGGKQMRHTMNKIISDHHQLTTNKVTKISLSAFDDKRWILDDGISSYAYGHWRIPT